MLIFNCLFSDGDQKKDLLTSPPEVATTVTPHEEQLADHEDTEEGSAASKPAPHEPESQSPAPTVTEKQ